MFGNVPVVLTIVKLLCDFGGDGVGWLDWGKVGFI